MPQGPVEYLESVLDEPLTPAQAFILKMVYGEPFNPGNDGIQTRDDLGHGPPSHHNEEEYLRYLHRRERSSTDTQTSLGFATAVLCLGRRSGKSHLTTLMQFYALHLFESIDQTRFWCLDLSPTREMAYRSQRALRELLSEHMLLQRETNTSLQVTIPGGKTVEFLFFSYGEALRRSHGIALDLITVQELGFEADNQGREAIEAIMPTLRQHTRLVLTSTPNGRRGSFHYFYQMAMRQPNWLALRIPTWEAYPAITEEQLQEIWTSDPIRFEGDFGANFVDPALLPQPIAPRGRTTVRHFPEEPQIPLPPPRSRYQILLEELELLQQVESVGLSSAPSDA
jgi:hypothetical protein